MRQIFPEFVRMRRRWFWIVCAVVSVACLFFAAFRFDSVVEIVGFTIVGGLAGTTLISILSIPFVWLLARKRVASSGQSESHSKI
jgi:FtsH-binding integral membrane protein